MSESDFSHPFKTDHITKKPVQKDISATKQDCIAIASRLKIPAVERLSASFTLLMTSPQTYHVTGTLDATVTQTSVISGENFTQNLTQDIDAWYTDTATVTSFEAEKQKRDANNDDEGHEIKDEKDAPDPVMNGEIDLGDIAVQFLGLALDDYPRAQGEDSGDYIEVEPDTTKPNPFAALEKLKEK